MSESPPATPDCPDRTMCRNCGEPIVWDEWSYVHWSNGWADCGTTMLLRRVQPEDPEILHVAAEVSRPMILSVVEHINQEQVLVDKRAEPVDWDYYGIPRRA